MKKLLFILWTLAVSMMASAQTPILSESFEGQQFPPSGWARETLSMSMYTWFRGGPLTTTDWFYNQYYVVPPDGVRMAALECDLNEEWGPQDESLITPLMAIDRPSVLTFETFCQYGISNYRDHYKVEVYDATGSWTTLWDAVEQPTVWLNQFQEPVSIDLSSFQGQDIKLRFHGHNDGYNVLTYPWFVDNVKVMPTDTIPTGVDETAFRVSLYPNPVEEIMTIQSFDEIQYICIYSILGIKVMERNLHDKEAVVDLSGLSPGVYFIEMLYKNHQKDIQSFIKQ